MIGMPSQGWSFLLSSSIGMGFFLCKACKKFFCHEFGHHKVTFHVIVNDQIFLGRKILRSLKCFFFFFLIECLKPFLWGKGVLSISAIRKCGRNMVKGWCPWSPDETSGVPFLGVQHWAQQGSSPQLTSGLHSCWMSF